MPQKINTWGLDVVATIATVVPVLGGPLGNVLSGISFTRKLGRIETFCQRVADELADLSAEVDEHYVREDEFEELLERTLKGVAEEPDSAKQTPYLRFLVDVLRERRPFEERLDELQQIGLTVPLGLTETDLAILSAAARLRLDSNDPLIMTDQLLPKVGPAVSEQQLVDALDILARSGFVEIKTKYGLGGAPPPYFTLRPAGCEQYVLGSVRDYPRVRRDVERLVAADEALSNVALAEALKRPVGLISHILERLAEQGLATVSLRAGNVLNVTNVSVPLKRKYAGEMADSGATEQPQAEG